MATNSTPPTKVILGCSKCGANLPDGSQFCLQCGKPVSSPPKVKAVAQPPEDAEALPSKASRPKHKGRRVLVLLLVLFIVAFAWAGLSENPIAQQLQELIGWKHDQTILDAPFTVGAHTFRYYKFSLPEGSVNVAIVGQFSAANVESRVVSSGKTAAKDKEKDKAGDNENGIEVSVLTEAAFTVWQNGYATSSIYDSGKVGEGKIQADVPAGAGIYYLVFSNKFAPKTAKTVHAAVVLRYKSWMPESLRKMKETVWNWMGL
jgi:hypothetical protein